jgi:hypothetical protein
MAIIPEDYIAFISDTNTFKQGNVPDYREDPISFTVRHDYAETLKKVG